MLTREQIEHLRKPFDIQQHRLVSGSPYIMKDAIRDRLDEVDAGWSMTAPELITELNDTIILRAGMVLCGITRHATGTGLITRYTKDGLERDPYAIARETAKAFKTADSDLLPRCASKFGVGDYLRNMTKAERDAVKDMTALKKFLDGLNKHWALNGGGIRINTKMKTLKLDPAHVLANVEPGHKLNRLSETTLTEEQFSLRLDELASLLAPAGGSADENPK